MRIRVLPFLLFLGCAELPAPVAGFPAAPGHWPHLRGPNLDGVSPETGLLREWPAGGPPLLWKTEGLGDGIPPVSVAGGLIFALGYKGEQEYLSSFDGDGKLVWTQPIGPSTGEVRIMRFLNQRAVTVDDDRVYAFTAAGILVCLASADGGVLWKVDYAKDLQGFRGGFGWTDTPVVEGNRLLCSPGGPKGALAALDKRSGKLLWRCESLKLRAENAGIAVAEIDGVRQALHLSLERVSGVDVADGRLLWSVERPGKTALNDPPIAQGSLVFVASGFGVGCSAFEVSRKDGVFAVRELYANKALSANHGNIVRVGGHLYSRDDRMLKCVELSRGEVVWSDGSVGMGPLACADGLLVLRPYRGDVLLLDAAPAAFRILGRLPTPDLPQDARFSFPVIAGGRLYLRYLDALYCYELRGPGFQPQASPWKIAARPRIAPPDPSLGKGPDAAFVPTPQDVVVRMLLEAGVQPGTRLLDLGSGDGRILITASRVHMAYATGVEINPDLVRLTRQRIQEGGLQQFAKVIEGDLFEADLTKAEVITLYLGEANNARLLPKLRLLSPGTRVVSHAHRLGEKGPPPDRTVKLTSQEDGLEHEIHVWTLPFRE